MDIKDVKVGETYLFNHEYGEYAESADTVKVLKVEADSPEEASINQILFPGEDVVIIEKVSDGTHGLVFAKELSPIV